MESSVVNFAKGCIYGAWVGDALGAVLEFRPVNEDAVTKALNMLGGGCFAVGPGQYTDDSELSICILRGLAESNGALNLD
jgi:ADP-ribosyl-[dinitrogen reductase] hydrolase